MSERRARGSLPLANKPRRRERPTPKWLSEVEVDAMARSRCLMVLSVLSGERPVTDVIEELQISRGTYYQLETKALKAMLAALAPGADASEETGPAAKQRELEQKVARLEREKRRAERLLLLTRQLVKPSPVVSGAGRPPGRRKRGSTKNGPKPYRVLAKTTAPSPGASASTPTPDGGDAR